MPRMLRRAAVLGATASVSSKRGQAKGAAAAEQQAAAAPLPAPEVAPAAAPPSNEDSYADLMRLKGLLDAGVLTQAEFDAQKQQILGG